MTFFFLFLTFKFIVAMLCRKPAIPDNSYIIHPGTNKGSYVHGTKLFMACHDGYYLTGLPIMECNQTVWLKMEFNCIGTPKYLNI